MRLVFTDRRDRDALLKYIEERITKQKDVTAVALCEERVADMARGAVAELKKLQELINTTGEV